MNRYSLLADAIAAIHLVYVSYVVLGQLVIMIGWPLGWRAIRNPWFRISHLIMILIVAVEAMVEFECPLTTWEHQLRVQAGQLDANSIEEGFVARLVHQIMFFDPKWGDVLTYSYYAVAGIVLATAFLVPPRFRKRPAGAAPIPSAPAPMAEGSGAPLTGR